jgi:hypothetical protein
MTRGESRLKPQHRFWEEDFPAREGEIGSNFHLYEELTSVDERAALVSRTSNILRGLGLLAGIVFSVLYFIFARDLGTHLLFGSSAELQYVLIEAATLFTATVFASWALAIFFRIDLRIPRDTPVRFNRQTGKVQAYEFQRTHNPFGKWPTVIKEFDWSTVEAEIHKQAGFNGKAYVVRYALVLCICKPGTTEVVDRVTLKANRIVTQDLHALWNYLRLYMRDGPEKLPPVKLLPAGTSFRRSFFEYMPWFDPTGDGHELRAKMPGWLLVFNSIVTVLAFWLIIPMGVCHYIAMRLAPEPKWPDEAAG